MTVPSDIADEIGYIKLRRKKIRATGILARKRLIQLLRVYIRCLIAVHLPRNSSVIYIHLCRAFSKII